MKKRNKANLGKRFESLIETTNRQYNITGKAVIEKMEVGNKFIDGQMIYSSKGPPDFMGAMTGGRAVVFDAKSTKGKSLPLVNITRRDHQLNFLEKMDALGALAFYLVEFADSRQVFVLPVPQVLAAIKRANDGGRKSIPLSEFKIEVQTSFHYALDYLDPLN
jgi:recombination protein U